MIEPRIETVEHNGITAEITFYPRMVESIDREIKFAQEFGTSRVAYTWAFGHTRFSEPVTVLTLDMMNRITHVFRQVTREGVMHADMDTTELQKFQERYG